MNNPKILMAKKKRGLPEKFLPKEIRKEVGFLSFREKVAFLGMGSFFGLIVSLLASILVNLIKESFKDSYYSYI